LIENNIVNIELGLFKALITPKLDSLGHIDLCATNGSSLKKTHTVCKEMLLDLRLDDPNVRLP